VYNEGFENLSDLSLLKDNMGFEEGLRYFVG
jgi:hypothetical protein